MGNSEKPTQPEKERMIEIGEPSHTKQVEQELTADNMEVQVPEVNVVGEVGVENNIMIEEEEIQNTSTISNELSKVDRNIEVSQKT